MTEGKTSRRAILGLGIAGAGAVVAVAADKLLTPATQMSDTAARASAPPAVRATKKAVPENSLAGDPNWAIRHLGAQADVEGYASAESVLPGESLDLFVSSTSPSVQVHAFRLGWYAGDGARKVWSSAAVRTGQQKAAAMTSGTNTVYTDWDPVLTVDTTDWPAGAYVFRLDAESGAQRYVPLVVRSASTAGKIVLKHAVQTWQAYNTWGGYDLYIGPGQSYSERSLAVSLNRPYDMNGADMFLTYERNLVKLAESLSLPLAYVTGSDIAGNSSLLSGASALVSLGHDEYWTPAERSTVTAARDGGMNLAFMGANAMFRRTRLSDDGRQVICYKTSYMSDPMYGVHNAVVTSDWRDGPAPNPESSLIGTIYEGYPANAPFVVTSPSAWLYNGTGVRSGDSFPNLVGVEYDRVNPAYPLERPIQVLSHSPLTCQGKFSYADSAYYTHSGGAGVYNSGTMRWVEALYGDQPHGIGGKTPGFVRQVTTNILRAFADGPAAAKYPAHDNLDTMHEFIGDPIGNSESLQ